MIVIVDYGMGNLASLKSKIERLKYSCLISREIADIERASKLIFPGVGNFAQGIRNIDAFGLRPVLERQVIGEKIPILGICLGMQLLTRFSEEGGVSGLGWVDAKTAKLSFLDNCLRVPHVGWDLVFPNRSSILLDDIPEKTRFYFTHSYAVHCNVRHDIVATTHYGYEFASIIEKENIFGTQFHPEKSHFTGLKIIENFLKNA